MKQIKVGSDFSGVGAFDQALRRLGIDYKTIFACDMDKYARQTYIENYGEPGYYPENVYQREIPGESLDIYMTSPPCQAFSLAGKRLGKDDKRGVLFFNSHEFIKTNKPKYFIFENVKGLLSDDNGNTFKEWINMLGGKSVNGLPVLFPYKNSVPYHIYYKVMNAKKHGVPQNRERIFLVGFKDIEHYYNFSFAPKVKLEKRLKDVLENDADEKYYLSESRIKYFKSAKRSVEPGTINTEYAPTCMASYYKTGTDSFFIKEPNCTPIGLLDIKGNASIRRVYPTDGLSPCLTTMEGGNRQPKIQVNSANKKGYEIASIGDSINLTHPGSKTRRGRVGKEVAQTLDCACNQAVVEINNPLKEICPTIAINSRQENNSLIEPIPLQLGNSKSRGEHIGKSGDSAFCLRASQCNGIIENDYRIRKLTPRECFRLQDFDDTFKFVVSNSQLYKQAGNSISVNISEMIFRQIELSRHTNMKKDTLF